MNLGYFEMCNFSEIWCSHFGGKFWMWSKLQETLTFEKNVPVRPKCEDAKSRGTTLLIKCEPTSFSTRCVTDSRRVSRDCPMVSICSLSFSKMPNFDISLQINFKKAGLFASLLDAIVAWKVLKCEFLVKMAQNHFSTCTDLGRLRCNSHYVTQYANLMIFKLLRIYMKLIFGILEVQNLSIYTSKASEFWFFKILAFFQG